MRKTIKNIILVLIFIFMISICNISFAAVSMSVTSSKNEVKPGESFTVTIKVSGGAGDINISADNGSVDKTHEWIEDGSVTVNCTAGNSGSTKINVSGTIANSDTAEDEKKSGSVTVKIKNESSANNGSTSSNGNTSSGNGNIGTTNTTTTKSSNANLSNLGIKPNDFSGFRANTTEYSVTVPNNVSQVEVYAKLPDGSKAKITSGTGKITLKEGVNEAKVVVKAEAGNTKTYTIKITREAKKEEKPVAVPTAPTAPTAQEEENQIHEEQILGLSKLDIENFEISPKFDTETYEYTLGLTEDLNSLNIKAEPNKEDAVVEIIGNENLQEGENVITILVTDNSGEEITTYQIIVNKNIIKKDVIGAVNWLQPKTWGMKEKVIVGTAAFIIFIIIIAIIAKVRLSKKYYEEYEMEFPGAEELDRALVEHQEIAEDMNCFDNIQQEQVEQPLSTKEETESTTSNLIEELYSSKFQDNTIEDNYDVATYIPAQHKGKHF